MAFIASSQAKAAVIASVVVAPIHETYRPVGRPQKQCAGIRSHSSAADIRLDIAAFQA